MKEERREEAVEEIIKTIGTKIEVKKMRKYPEIEIEKGR